MATESKTEFYNRINVECKAILEGENDWIANCANISAIIYEELNKRSNNAVNWAGFYLIKKNQLVLGPFQGKAACIRIAIGKGVCGTSVSKKSTIIVPNVHEFPGHIACDEASNSEIVVPIFLKKENQEPHVVGVLDLDSKELNTFDKEDQEGLEKIVEHLVNACDWSNLLEWK